VPVLDTFKTEQSPLARVLPRTGAFAPHPSRMDGGVAEACASTLSRLAVARLLFDVRTQARIDNAWAIVGRIKTASEVEVGPVEIPPHLFDHPFPGVQALRA
jgi:hypothetical protein